MGKTGTRSSGARYASARTNIDSRAKIESILYRSNVPDEMFSVLVPHLRGIPKELLEATVPLYRRLTGYPHLDDEAKAYILLKLVTSRVAGLVAKGRNGALGKYIDGVVASYEPSDEKLSVRHERTRDRHSGVGRMIYGRKDAEIHYGSVLDTVPNMESMRNQSAKQIRKAKEMVGYVNAGKWNFVTEAHRDLIDFPSHIFNNATTYRQFLFAVESITKQESTLHKIVIVYDKKSRLPIGYRVSNPQQYATASSYVVKDRDKIKAKAKGGKRGRDLIGIDLLLQGAGVTDDHHPEPFDEEIITDGDREETLEIITQMGATRLSSIPTFKKK